MWYLIFNSWPLNTRRGACTISTSRSTILKHIQALPTYNQHGTADFVAWTQEGWKCWCKMKWCKVLICKSSVKELQAGWQVDPFSYWSTVMCAERSPWVVVGTSSRSSMTTYTCYTFQCRCAGVTSPSFLCGQLEDILLASIQTSIEQCGELAPHVENLSSLSF